MNKLLFFSAFLLLGFVLSSCDNPVACVTGISLDKHSLELVVGETETLTATVASGNAGRFQVVWASSNPAVATVSTAGAVTAVSVGTAIITVNIAGDVHTATAAVTVDYIPTSINGVVINGIRWATRNVNTPGTFAVSPESAGMFYQWNRRHAWAAVGNVTSWDSTVAAGTSWTRDNDPCPAGWRVPTEVELTSLQEVGGSWTTRNGVEGRMFGTTPYQLFLPAAGWRDDSTGALSNAGEWGFYWSSRLTEANNAQNLQFGQFASSVSNVVLQATGFNVRCVAE